MLELYIDNKQCDLAGNETIAIDYAIFSLQDISARKGTRGYNFILPDTANNRAALGIPAEIDNISRAPYKKLKARLYSDGVDLNIRVATLEYAKDGYGINLYGITSDFFEQIKNKKIADINLTAYDHDYTLANVVGTRLNNSVFIYPIVNYGADGSTMNNTAREVDSVGLLPAVFADTVLQKMVEETGNSYVNNMDNVAEYTANKLLIPCVSQYIGVKYNAVFNFDTDTPCRTSALGYINPMNVSSINTYAGTYWALPYPTQYTYQTMVTPANGLYFQDNINCKFRLTLILDNTSGGNALLRVFMSDGASSNGHTLEIISRIIPVGAATYVFEIDMNDSAFSIFNNQRTLIFFPVSAAGAGLVVKGGSTLEVYEADESATVIYNTRIKLSSALPDFKQSDFLKAYCQLYFVIPVPNESKKTVTLRRFDEIAENINNAVDWSDKLDLSEKPEISFTPNGYAQLNRFLWEADDNEIQPPGTNGEWLIDNENLEPENETVSLSFASTNTSLQLKGIPVPEIGIIEAGEFKNSKTPRMLLLAHTPLSELADTSDFTYKHGVSTSVFTGTDTIPLCRFIDTSKTYNLGFGNSILPLFGRTIFEVVEDFKQVTCLFRLNAVDINQLDFFKPVYVKYFNAYFYINKINAYQPDSNESTEVELVKLF